MTISRRSVTIFALLCTAIPSTAAFLLHCTSSDSAGTPGENADGGLLDGNGSYQPCTACNANQICSNGQCVDIPATCPCPSGTYCKLDVNQCQRGCIENAHCSSGEYCKTDTRECLVGCRDDDGCKDSESCDPDTHVCQLSCRGTKCQLPDRCVKSGDTVSCKTEWRSIAAPAHIESLTTDHPYHKAIYALVSTPGTLELSISRLDLETEKWTHDIISSKTWDMAQIAWAQSRIYAVGGYVKTDAGTREPTGRIRSFQDTPSPSWQDEKPSLAFVQTEHGMAVHHGQTYYREPSWIYVGTGDSVDRLEAPYYELTYERAKWNDFMHGTDSVKYPGVAVHGDWVYKTGGLNAAGAPTSKIYKAKIVKDGASLELAGTLRVPRGRHAAASGVSGAEVIVFGGDASKRSVETFPGGELTPLPAAANIVSVASNGSTYYVAADDGRIFTNKRPLKPAAP